MSGRQHRRGGRTRRHPRLVSKRLFPELAGAALVDQLDTLTAECDCPVVARVPARAGPLVAVRLHEHDCPRLHQLKWGKA